MRLNLNIALVLGLIFSYNSYAIETSQNNKRIDLKDFDLSLTEQTNKQSANYKKKITLPHFDRQLNQQTFIWSEKTKTYGGAKQSLISSNSNKKSASANKGVVSDIDIARDYLQNYFPQSENKNTGNKAQANRDITGSNVYVASSHASPKFGPSIVKFRQKYDGIEVFAREATVLMDKNKDLVAVSGYLAKSKPSISSNIQQKSSDMAANAIRIAFEDMGISAELVADQTQAQSDNPYTHYQASTENSTLTIDGTTRAKRVWYEFNGELIPAHYVEVGARGRVNENEQYQYGYVIADATTGKSNTQILFRKNQIQYESYHYRTFADSNRNNTPFRAPLKNPYPLVGLSPEESEQTVPLDYIPDSHQLVTLEHGPISTQDPWLPEGATQTVGNNVDAYLDIAAEDGLTEGDFRAEVTSPNTFDWAYDPQFPASLGSGKAAVVNLFYMNNWLHDYFYDFGFDEAAGNAQTNNFDRGGLGGDVLLAEGQDYSFRNNANMRTPADGVSPRMQMYTFLGFYEKGESFDLLVTSSQDITLNSARPGEVGPVEFGSLSGKLVRVTQTCSAPSNPEEIEGNIALVSQPFFFCAITTPIKFAQDAGAKAVILEGSSPFAPIVYSFDSGVTIPNFSIDSIDGSQLKAAIEEGNEVSINMYRDYLPDRDGTNDNGIVAHEWGHYLTNRLVGNAAGLTTNQSRGMGEGWSDFLAIYFAIEEEHRNIPGNEQFQGLYSSGGWAVPSMYYGIRRVPYTTDMNYNAVTFQNIDAAVPFEFDHPIAGTGNNAAVHATGEFWANTLLEVYVSLLNDTQRLSFSDAKERMAYYLVAGLKLTPIAPTFTEARDGILAAAYATDPDDHDRMAAAFAKRGLGAKAISPDRRSFNNAGATNSFDAKVATFDIQSSRIEIEKSFSDFDFSKADAAELSHYSLQESSKFHCPKDGVLDVFELGELIVELKNTGNVALENLVAKVSSNVGFNLFFLNLGYARVENMEPYSDDNVTIRFPFVLLNAKTAQDVTIDIEFPQFNENIEYPETQTMELTVNYDLAKDPERTMDDLENSLTAKNDWTVQVDNPAPDTPNYLDVLNNTFTLDNKANDETYGTGQMWSALDNSFSTDVSLVSPTVNISETQAFSFSFDHAHDFEPNSWDGAVIEISVDGGQWIDVVDAGGTVNGYAYNGIIRTGSTQVLSGRAGFVNSNLELNKTTVDFADSLAGQSVQFRFRMGTDLSIGAPGWLIDNIVFNGIDSAPFSKVVRNRLWCFK